MDAVGEQALISGRRGVQSGSKLIADSAMLDEADKRQNEQYES